MSFRVLFVNCWWTFPDKLTWPGRLMRQVLMWQNVISEVLVRGKVWNYFIPNTSRNNALGHDQRIIYCHWCTSGFLFTSFFLLQCWFVTCFIYQVITLVIFILNVGLLQLFLLKIIISLCSTTSVFRRKAEESCVWMRDASIISRLQPWNSKGKTNTNYRGSACMRVHMLQ